MREPDDRTLPRTTLALARTSNFTIETGIGWSSGKWTADLVVTNGASSRRWSWIVGSLSVRLT